MHPTHNIQTGKAWIKVGQKKELLSNSGRARCNLHGVYNPHNQDVIARDYKTINWETTKAFFEEVQSFYEGASTIHIIVDNARYYKNKDLKNWLKDSCIKIFFLPTYSPNLNLIERFWKCLKNETIYNQYYEKYTDFKQAILDFCNKSSPQHKALLKRSVGTKLHLLKPV